MAIRTFIVNLQGGDIVTADTDLIFNIYTSSDAYATPYLITGSHTTDANVTVSSGVATIVKECGTETLFKISAVDEAGNESALSLETGISDTTAPATPTITAVVDLSTLMPKLSNFRIEDANLDRVLFDASSDITGLTSTGFTISGKTISSLTIDGDGLGGYFTVSVAFTFWDNNTIRLESGDGTVYDFTLQYVKNNISEPTASTVRYASRLGSGATDGLAEGSAWSWAQVQTNAAAGMTIHVKAGGDFSGITISAIGTSTNPIVIKGYKTTIGDLDGIDYYWGGAAYATTNTISNIDAPTLKGAGGATTSNGFSVTGDYVIINNFQSYDWKNNFYFSGNNGLVVDNCYSDATSTSDGSNYYHNLNTLGRVTNSVARNFDLHGMVTYDSPILYDGVDFYLDVVTGGDYFTHISGDNSITRNCTLLKAISGANGNHGLTIKGVSGAQYNLIENCTVTNNVDAIELRWDEVQNNVVRNITVNRDGAVLKTDCYGLYIMNGASYNTVENCKFIDIERGVVVIDSDEDLTNTNKGQYNVIKNNIFDRVNHVIRMEAATGSSVGNVFQFNDFIFNTVYSGSYLFLGFGAGEQANNNFTNNIVHTIANRVSGTSGFTETYNNYYNGFTMPAGTGNLSLNPNFVDLVDFVPQETGLKAGTPLTGVEYDFDGTERDDTNPTIGVKEI